jgi:cation-transporting ATPase E
VIIERFNPALDQGLTNQQVLERQKANLVNYTKQKSSKPFVKILFDNLFTYFNLIYLIIFIALISVKSYNDMMFVVVVSANVLIAIVQETRAKATVEKLRLVTVPKAQAIRNGKRISLMANKLVLDDIIVLSVGSQIPADCIVMDGVVDVNESLLTGESKPVKKVVGDKLLAGSFLTSGECLARVEKVGKDSYIQSLAAQAKQFKSPSSNLFKDLKTIIKYIGIMMVPVGALMFINNYFGQTKDLTLAIIRTCASLIGMIPAGMFLLISIALSVGVIKLAGKKTLVKDLYSIENLARVNVLCLDKTGTITDGTMQVK